MSRAGSDARHPTTTMEGDPVDRQPKALGPLERQVLEILWDHGPLTVRQVIDQLPTDPAYTTIATVLTNLKRKRYVRSQREGSSTRYVPVTSRADHDAAVMGGVLAASRDRSATILRFADSMSAEDLDLLREHLRTQGGER
ncbi:Predicted transcriptional regulator [Brevibacterium sp. Mu109]|nr:Predicted transcriptional regulator [Brevibacterium sp. Mu109]